jgi:hypothetical protein
MAKKDDKNQEPYDNHDLSPIDDEIIDEEYVDSPTEEEPIKNLFFLLLMIPAAPFIFLYSIFTGKPQNPIIIGGFAVVLVMGVIIYFVFSDSKEHNEKLILINSMVDELSPEYKDNLKNEFSTLREEFKDGTLPSQLEPMMDIKQDMITINYYHYLYNAGYLGQNAEGAAEVLRNSLYSEQPKLIEAAWKSLALINTDYSKQIMTSYEKFAIERAENMKKTAGDRRKMPRSTAESIAQDIKNSINIRRSRSGF